MSEKAYMPKEMLDTWRTMMLHVWPEKHGGWALFGYIDWLEERLDGGYAMGDWRPK